MKKNNDKIRQFGALPYRIVQGQPEILLITTRASKRWIVPKGWPEDGMNGAEVARMEAYEEAGIRGTTSKSIGVFEYDKEMDSKIKIHTEVKLYPLLVEEQFSNWPEAHERERQWFSQADAQKKVSIKSLKKLIKHIDFSHKDFHNLQKQTN